MQAPRLARVGGAVKPIPTEEQIARQTRLRVAIRNPFGVMRPDVELDATSHPVEQCWTTGDYGIQVQVLRHGTGWLTRLLYEGHVTAIRYHRLQTTAYVHAGKLTETHIKRAPQALRRDRDHV